VTARFAPGDRVRTRAAHAQGHTRLPRYLCNRTGTIEAVHGMYPLPDERALGMALASCTKEALYTVIFEGNEVWRERAVEPLSVSADLWESYLAAEGA
jgi:nitrile hydratase subunit beta